MSLKRLRNAAEMLPEMLQKLHRNYVDQSKKTEEQIKAEGIEYNKGSFPMMANSRARTVGETEGIIKVLSRKDNDQILGIHIIGANAGEMIAEGVLAMEYGASAEDIGRTCHAHPTMSEAFKEAAMATYDKPIHF